MGHVTKECPTLPAFREMLHDQANFVNQFKKPSTFSETYNPGWRNHPNFSWRNNTNNNVPQQKSDSFYFSPQVEGQSSSSNLEDVMKQFIQSQTATNQKNAQGICEIKSTLSKLTSSLSIQEKGKFSSQVQPNPLHS